MAKRNLVDRVRGVLGVQHREPEVVVQSPPELATREPAESPAHFWPADQKLPATWSRRVVPCPACRRVCLPTGSQAVACTSTGKDFAHFRCRSCGHRFKLAVRP